MSRGQHSDVASLHTQDCVLLSSENLDLWSNSVTHADQTFTICTPLLMGHDTDASV